ncbi:MAG: nitrate reductase molybdenum cofactor assembly chaperone [bacterium]
MNEESRLLLRLLARLAAYPDEGWAELLEGRDSWPKGPLHAAEWERCGDFLARRSAEPLLRQMEEYTQTFYLSAPSCLDLTWHRWDDERVRRNALAHLVGLYRQAGYACTAREMPDHLPVVLEFLSLAREETGRWIVETYAEAVSIIASSLRERASPYVPLFDAILSVFEALRNGGPR